MSTQQSNDEFWQSVLRVSGGTKHEAATAAEGESHPVIIPAQEDESWEAEELDYE